ncbi:MAG: HAMP domain-containing histidine kinase, partial [Clostridia bacterium]|nr:HAMP domain-containing histidine kinase [Clostridia bacterium]
ALNLAEKLSSGNMRGWTGVYYRYRVDKSKGETTVTVLDQSRELLPAWRILLFSVAGETVGLAVCLLFLTVVSKKIFRPLEEADRKQLAFTVEAEKRFKVPLTVINLNAELLERKYGPDESTQAIRTEVRKMSETTRQLAKFHLVGERDVSAVPVDVSSVVSKAAESAKDRLNSSGVTLICEIEPGITLSCDEESFKKIADELIDNIRKFAAGEAVLSLRKERGHVALISENETILPDGSYDQVFDRFTRLHNADGVPGYGLGLSYFKDTVTALGGRVCAGCSGGRFTVKAVF